MDFRRWFTALAVLALFAGLASAQTTFQCNVTTVTPLLRTEGVTELIGDIQIRCTGGSLLANGTAIPTANIRVGLQAPITSRVLGTSSGVNYTEAVLLIDDPNVAEFNRCTNPGNPLPTCQQWSFNGEQSSSSTAAAAPINIFPGVIPPEATNQVEFRGVPILAPVSSGAERVFRITNVRIDARSLFGSIVTGLQQVQAIISVSPPQALPNTQAQVTVGFAQKSLLDAVRPAGNQFLQCSTLFGSIAETNPQDANVAILSFQELFPNAFKTRIVPQATPAVLSNSNNTSTQNVPGTVYPSESGLIIPALTGPSSTVAGLANAPTQLRAVFSNLPAGARLWVSRRNVSVSGGVYSPLAGQTGTPGDTSIISLAQLVSGTGSTQVEAYGVTDLDVQQVTITNGSATVVWEILNANPAASEDFQFAVFLEYTPNATLTQPGLIAPDVATVRLSYHPTVPPENVTNIPRFADTSTPRTGWLNIIPCQTILLFPYVTSADGFDTGIAISNTAQDPLGTQTSTGSCTLNFYGVNAPTNPVPFSDGPLGVLNTTVTPNIRPTRAILASNAATNFTGYVFAVCNFQFAHGFAFVSDVGARNLAMGYLALVVNNGDQLVERGRTVTAESLNN